MDENKYKNILSKMCSLCARGEKCEFDILQKLDKYEITINDKERITTYLIDNNYINNERYANAYVNDKFKFNKWGRNKIRQNLKFKKIDNKFIEKALDDINVTDYELELNSILLKKRKQIKDTDKYKIKQKLVNHAVSKGYELDLILNAI